MAVEKITATTFEKAIKANKEDIIVKKEWNGLTVVIHKTISLKAMMEFVDMVVKTCFENNGEDYLPEIKQFVIDCCIVEKYTNITLPQDLTKKYNMIMNTDIVQFVTEYISTGQLNEIIKAIDEKIKYKICTNTESFNKKMNEIADMCEQMYAQAEALFGSVSGEEIKELTKIMSEFNIDEEKLAKVVLKNKK